MATDELGLTQIDTDKCRVCFLADRRRGKKALALRQAQEENSGLLSGAGFARGSVNGGGL